MIIISPHLLRHWLRLKGDEWPIRYAWQLWVCVRVHVRNGVVLFHWILTDVLCHVCCVGIHQTRSATQWRIQKGSSHYCENYTSEGTCEQCCTCTHAHACTHVQTQTRQWRIQKGTSHYPHQKVHPHIRAHPCTHLALHTLTQSTSNKALIITRKLLTRRHACICKRASTRSRMHTQHDLDTQAHTFTHDRNWWFFFNPPPCNKFCFLLFCFQWIHELSTNNWALMKMTKLRSLFVDIRVSITHKHFCACHKKK